MSMLLKRICGVLLLVPFLAGAQARLVLNGAIINIANGAQLVVDNPAPNALTRYAGHFITTGETDLLKWNIGTRTGTYTVPLGYGNATYLPLQFTKTAGAGYGSFLFASYHTSWRNSDQLPSGVTNIMFNAMNYSTFTVDRFWKISTDHYSSLPALTNLTFSYADAEVAAPNTITESNLGPRRWNAALQTWVDYTPSATANPAANTVTLTSLPAAQLQEWWMLTDNVQVLPLQWLVFTAAAEGAAARLNWATAGTKAGAVFTIERSADAMHFEAAGTVPGGNGNQPYTFLDVEALAGLSYYRIKETTAEGAVYYSMVRRVFIQTVTSDFNVYPNPVVGHRCTVTLPNNLSGQVRLELVGLSGSVVWSQAVPEGRQRIAVSFPDALAPGAYLLNVITAQHVWQQKLVVY